jgi:hypothetical protein
VRGLEPLFAVVLTWTTGARGGSLNRQAAVGLVGLMIGAALTCMSQPRLSLPGLLLGMCSNFMFAMRGIFTTMFQDK